MKIIIIGAGQVGSTLAENLSFEDNDITIIDINDTKLHKLNERMDVLTLLGNGAYPNILRRGGAEEANMLIAVTESDETNLVACQVADILFQVPKKIARIRARQYLENQELFGASAFSVDVLISPEELVTHYIRSLIDYPNALQVLDFANHRVQMVAIKIDSETCAFVNHSIKSLRQYFVDLDMRVIVIFRNGVAIIPTGTTLIEANDELHFLTAREHVRHVMSKLTSFGFGYKRIMIAGGGHIGSSLAESLEKHYSVKIIEKNKKRVEWIATQLSKTVVLLGDATDKELLVSENIEDVDLFCALTNLDEANIMSALLAKKLGARKVMALINRPSYLELWQEGLIDMVISPEQITIGALLTHIRRGHVVNVYSLRRGAAEAMEVIVHGNKNTSKVVGRAIKDIPLPTGAIIGAIVRDNQILMGQQSVVVEEFDRVILFLADKRKLKQVEWLFQAEAAA